MNKLRLFLMVLALGLSTVAFADEAAVSQSEASQQAACGGYTTCFPPYAPPFTIQCQTWGQGCSWWVVPNNSVQCTGFDQFGRWVNLFYRCF